MQRIGRILLPPWFNLVVVGAAIAFVLLLGVVLPVQEVPYVKVAFIGNSMQYYNDLPRLMESLSDGHIEQNSCLHGNANFKSLLTMGNGMYNIWNSGSARIQDGPGRTSSLKDYGACTVAQLLFGYDADLAQRVGEMATDDAADDAVQVEKVYGDDYFSYNDGTNPCLQDTSYYEYLETIYEMNGPPTYDYVVLNDNTRSPARSETRATSLQILEDTYVPWLLEVGAIPILLLTYAYWTPYRDMSGLGSVPEFASLTYEGYKQYAELLEKNLPESQKPRIAPVGLAFLLVWEENFGLWERLFHVDQVHNSPLGTYLQGCVIHHTIFGTLPRAEVAVKGDMFSLWLKARRFQPGDRRRDPFPTEAEASYLYDVARRVTIFGHTPKSLILYKNGESASYLPQDDLYSIDDLF